MTLREQAGMPRTFSMRFPSLLIAAAIVGGLLMPGVEAADQPVRFFANGALVGLSVGGEDVHRETQERDGFFVVSFDGLQVRRTPLEHVVATDGTIRVTGEGGLPRLTFTAATDGTALALRLVRAEGMPRGRDRSILFRATTNRRVFANGTDPRVRVDARPTSLEIAWTGLGDKVPVSGEPGVVLDLNESPAPLAAPPPRPASGGRGLPLPFTSINAAGKGRFSLLRFNGIGIEPLPLHVLEWRDGTLVVGLPDTAEPKFTFRVAENEHYLTIALVKADGDFSARDTGLIFESREPKPRDVFRLNYMARGASDPGRILLVWPYLWNPNRADPLGSFGILRSTADDAARDQALAALWAEGTLPHPAIGRPWTAAEAAAWIDAYEQKFAGLSETILAAADRAELDALTDWTHRTGVRRIYLHTDTWRAEYWPRERSFVDVNRAVFPGGRADLVAFGRQLHDRGMQWQLHSVSGGIGRKDPELVVGGRVDPRLATWVCGRLEKAVDDKATELIFRPDPEPHFPHLRLDSRNWNLRTFRIGSEIVTVGELFDLDQPVWTLRRVSRGVDGTPRSAHAADAEAAGLIVAYGQNYVPDNNSDLLTEMADRYAQIINEAQLDHQHYDGAEIHRHLEPWGFDKFSALVASRLDRATTSSTSGGRPAPWNIELEFSRIRELRELGFWPLAVPVLLDGHRPATSWLDAHYELASAWLKSARRLGFTKPEPMFGISEEIRSRHGLMPRYEKLLATWRSALPTCSPADTAYLSTLLAKVQSPLRQAGHHHQAFDVPVLEATPAGRAFVPTRVLLRPGLDAPWIVGQEFGPHGPRQYVQPGETIQLENPHPAQSPEVILRVLPALEGAGRGDPPQPGPGSLWPEAKAIRPRGATTITWQEGAMLLTATNSTARDFWEEEALPTWGCRVPLRDRRGVLLEVEGDGSGAVLVVQLHGAGMRDYVVKLDFIGPRQIVIPNGEVAWSAGCWGWRFGAKQFDYRGELRAVSLGFGHLPAKASARVVVRRLELMENATGVLRDPVVRVCDGFVRLRGDVHEHEYLVIDAEGGAEIFDRNWKRLRKIESTRERFIAPVGGVTARIDAASRDNEPLPWCEVQVITRGPPHLLGQVPAEPTRSQ